MTKEKIKIVIPNKGRLQESAIQILRTIGLDFEVAERQLTTTAYNYNADILLAGASNISEYVQDGVADIGITGHDLVEESTAKVVTLEKLGFGRANLVIAVPITSKIKNLKDLEAKKVSTPFPVLTKNFFREKKIKADVIKVSGAVEITPSLGLCDAISDLVSSGNTLRMNQLRAITTIFESQAVLIGNPASLENKSGYIDELLLRLRSVLTAKNKRYIMMNAPSSILGKIKKVAPGLASPTVMSLSDPAMIAVHSVIDADEVWRVVAELEKIGASGILVVPIERMIP